MVRDVIVNNDLDEDKKSWVKMQHLCVQKKISLSTLLFDSSLQEAKAGRE